MIKYFIVFFFLFLNTFFKCQSLEEIRSAYSQFVSNKELSQKFLSSLEKNKNISAEHLCYYGSLQTIWANHTANPINKLNTFNKGKKNIEKAIEMEPNNVELRFIRLSIQKNIPSFLGYNDDIEKDKEFLIKNIKSVQSKSLFKNIQTLLK